MPATEPLWPLGGWLVPRGGMRDNGDDEEDDEEEVVVPVGWTAALGGCAGSGSALSGAAGSSKRSASTSYPALLLMSAPASVLRRFEPAVLDAWPAAPVDWPVAAPERPRFEPAGVGEITKPCSSTCCCAPPRACCEELALVSVLDCLALSLSTCRSSSEADRSQMAPCRFHAATHRFA